MASTDITATEEWAALARHARELQADRHALARAVLETDPSRASRLALTVGDLVVDWSRHSGDRRDRRAAAGVGRPGRCGRADRRPKLAGDLGEPHRGSARPAHRAPGRSRRPALVTGGVDVMPAVHVRARTHGRLCPLRCRSTERRGRRRAGRSAPWSISGSAGRTWAWPWPTRRWPPSGARRALTAVSWPMSTRPTWRRCSVTGLDPAETLFVVVSKSFTTAETLANARAARDWADRGARPGCSGSTTSRRRLRMPPRRLSSAIRTLATSSRCGTGWAVATRWARPLDCRS